MLKNPGSLLGLEKVDELMSRGAILAPICEADPTITIDLVLDALRALWFGEHEFQHRLPRKILELVTIPAKNKH